MFTPAGEFRHRVEIIAVGAGTPDKFGTRPETLTTEETVWAKLEPISGKDLERAKAAGNATASHTITIRYRPGVTTKHNLRFKGRRFLINAVLNVLEMNVELKITATEIIGL